MLPSGNPAGMTNDAPTTSGIPDLSVAAGTVDQVLALTDFFADAADPARKTWSIRSSRTRNPSLFNSLAIDSGNLTLTFANGATGDAVADHPRHRQRGPDGGHHAGRPRQPRPGDQRFLLHQRYWRLSGP